MMNAIMTQRENVTKKHNNFSFISSQNLIVFFVLFCLSIMLWLPRFHGPIDLRWDAGVYYVLGTSITEGKGYRLLNEPGEIKAIQYPPLLPIIISAHQRICGSKDPMVVGFWLRLGYFVIFTVYIWAIYWMALHYLSPKFAFLTSLMCAMHLQTYFFSNALFAEIPFALVTIFFIIVHPKSEKITLFLLTIFLAWSSFFLRTAGIILLGAWILESLFRKRFKKTLLRLIICLIPVLAWQGYVWKVKSSHEYNYPEYPYQRADYQFYNVGYLENILLIDSFVPELGKASLYDMARRILDNTINLPLYLGEAVSAARGFWQSPPRFLRKSLPKLPLIVIYAVLIVFFIIICSGAVVFFIRRHWFILIYILGTLAMICFTPWPGQFLRYLSPITPFLLLLFFSALMAAEESSQMMHSHSLKTAFHFFIYGVIMIILVVESYATYRVFRGKLTTARHYDQTGHEIRSQLFYHDSAWRAFDLSAEWLKASASHNAIVCTSAPHLLYLKTGLQAVQPPFEPDPDYAQSLLDAVPVKYVIIDSIENPDVSRRYAYPVVQRKELSLEDKGPPDLWKLVYTDPNKKVKIFQRVKERAME